MANTEITSSSIVQRFLDETLSPGEARVAKSTYEVLCLSFQKVSAWGKEDAMKKILLQFLEGDCIPLLDERCDKIVNALMAIDLCELWPESQKLWCELMIQVAKEHLCWTDKIVDNFSKRFVPACRNGDTGKDRLWPEEKMRPVYTAVQESLWRLCTEFPPTVFVLRKCVEENFPFLGKPVFQIKDYFINILHITSWQPPEELNRKIWSLLIDSLVELDVQKSFPNVHKKTTESAVAGFFQMDEELEQMETECQDGEDRAVSEKLDACLCSLLQFINFWCRNSDDPKDDDSGINKEMVKSLYKSLMIPFGSCVLNTHELRYTPFVWFYLCSYDSELADKFLEWLWEEVETPGSAKEVFRQHARKSHAAACYMSGLLARAQYIDIGTTKKWISVWTQWTRQYLDTTEFLGKKDCGEGRLGHGTFYAICQAIFFVVAFRYKELLGTGNEGLDEMRRWGLDRLVNCSLNPFRYCASQVVMNFANVCRGLQIVYCHHIIEKNRRKDLHERDILSLQTPFEGFFPFDPCDLQECAKFIKPIYRNYHGLSDGSAGTANSEAAWNKERARRISAVYDEYDFIEEQDDVLISYGASPGFKHIELLLLEEFDNMEN